MRGAGKRRGEDEGDKKVKEENQGDDNVFSTHYLIYTLFFYTLFNQLTPFKENN